MSSNQARIIDRLTEECTSLRDEVARLTAQVAEWEDRAVLAENTLIATRKAALRETDTLKAQVDERSQYAEALEDRIAAFESPTFDLGYCDVCDRENCTAHDLDDRLAVRRDQVRGLRERAEALEAQVAALARGCEATLAFYAIPWDPKRWKELTGSDEGTTKVLCDFIRAALRATEDDHV
jgi:hypothetical protein